MGSEVRNKEKRRKLKFKKVSGTWYVVVRWAKPDRVVPVIIKYQWGWIAYVRSSG